MSAELCAGGNGVVQQQQVQLFLALFLMDGRDQHAAGGDAHHLPGGQVQNGHGGFADELLRLIIVMDARYDGAVRAGAVIQSELQQLVALLHGLAVLDLHGPEIGPAEGVKVHVLLGIGLQLQGRQSGLALGLLDGVELSQGLLGVDAGEQGLALVNGDVRAQAAPHVGLFPGAAARAGSDLVKDLFGAVGNEGGQQHGADADGFQQVIHNRGQAGPVGGVLGQGPGGVLVDILVGPLDGLEHLLQGVLELEVLHLRLIAVPQGGGHGLQVAVGVAVFPLRGQGAAEVFLHHGGGAADQVAQVVGQVHVDGLDQQLVGEVAVGAEGEGPQQEEAQGVHAELLRQDIGVHHVALGLGHLAAVHHQPAVAVNVLGQGHFHAHEHGGPDNGVEPDDLLAHKVDVGGPILVVVVIPVVHKAQGGGVVEQSVHPDVYHMARVKVHGNAPGEAGAADAQVLQARLDEVVDHLVDPGAGLQEVGVLQQVPDPVGILGQAEEIGLLLGVHDLAAAVGALAVHQLALGPEALAGLAVFALVGALVDVALFVHLAEDLLDGGTVVIVGGADEAVVGDVHQLPQVQDALGALHDVVQELLGGLSGGLGLVLDLLAVLVGARQEQHVAAGEPLVAGHGVGGHGAVGVADVQLVGGVINGGRDVEFLLFHGDLSPFPPLRMEERLKIMHITFGVFPTAGKRGKQKTPPAAAKGDAQHRDTTLLRRFLAKSGLMERPHAPVL